MISAIDVNKLQIIVTIVLEQVNPDVVITSSRANETSMEIMRDFGKYECD